MSQHEYNIAVSAANGRPQRLVSIERSDGTAFRDRMDPNSATSRRRLIGKAAIRFARAAAELEWLDEAIVEAADRADDAADRELSQELQDEQKNTADLLVDLALGHYRIGRTQADEPFAVEINGPNVALMFRGSRDALRSALAARFRETYGRTPNSSALTDALTALQGEAFAADPEEVHLRVAEHEHQIVIDLGNTSGHAAVVSPLGWELVERSPVLFRRTAATGSLPAPTRGGTIEELRSLVNVSPESWPLVVGWLIAGFIPRIPHPILLLGGQQGTGKTTAARQIGGLIDPSPAQLRSQPRDPETWAVSASASWLVSVDNISTISDWWSDSLCKAVTGDGWLRRKLYTDGDLAVLSFRRVILLTSIDPGALRGDLGDRVLLVDLEPIDETSRQTERDIEDRYDATRPRVFGALLDILSLVLTELPRVRLDRLPRMADFGRILAALDAVIGDGAESSFEIYMRQRGRVADTVIESDPVALAIEALVREEEVWHGTASELLARILPERPNKEWPRSPQGLGGRISRLTPALGLAGIAITHGREGHARSRKYHITRTADEAGRRLSAMSALSAAAENMQEECPLVRTTEDKCGQVDELDCPLESDEILDGDWPADNADIADNTFHAPSCDGADKLRGWQGSLCSGWLAPDEEQRFHERERSSGCKD